MSKLLEAKQQLVDLEFAQGLKDYKEEYLFDFVSVQGERDFTHPHVKELVEACNQTKVNFLPDVVTQSIEMEAFNRFKSLVTRHIEGKSIATLMGMKNDIERHMIASQIELVKAKIKDLEAAVLPKEADLPKEAVLPKAKRLK